MLQWFVRINEFAEFTEFNDSSAPFRKNSNVPEIIPSNTTNQISPSWTQAVSLEFFTNSTMQEIQIANFVSNEVCNLKL